MNRQVCQVLITQASPVYASLTHESQTQCLSKTPEQSTILSLTLASLFTVPLCYVTYNGWDDLLKHIQMLASCEDGEAHRNQRRTMENKTCPYDSTEEDYENLFTHIDVQEHGDFDYRRRGKKQAFIATLPAPSDDGARLDNSPPTTIADPLPHSSSSRISASSHGHSLLPHPKTSNLSRMPQPYEYIHTDYNGNVPMSHLAQPHAMEQGMATCGPLKVNTRITRIIRPSGSEAVIDWMKDAEVKIVIEDLLDVGWFIIKSEAFRSEPGSEINQKELIEFPVMGVSLTLILRLLRTFPVRNRYPPSCQTGPNLGCH